MNEIAVSHLNKLVDGIFYASLIFVKEGQEQTIDARTSDAIALALRYKAPIFTYKTILDKAGVELKGPSYKKTESTLSAVDEEVRSGFDLKNLSLSELHKLLEEAVTNEEYEKAASIRDEISKRS